MKYRSPRSLNAAIAARSIGNPTKDRVAPVKSTRASRKAERQNRKRGRS
jgi:hypothetical protein